jgi:cytochrome c2
MKRRAVFGLMASVFSASLIGMLTLTVHAGGPSPEAGREVFAKRCSGCHDPDSNKEGPRLRGIVGRKAAVVDFPYSTALRNSGLVWDESLLDKWLENSRALVKDNDMEFHLSNRAERALVIAYLKSLSK